MSSVGKIFGCFCVYLSMWFSILGCSGSSKGSTCRPGSEGCSCAPEISCDTGLVCLSNQCVKGVSGSDDGSVMDTRPASIGDDSGVQDVGARGDGGTGGIFVMGGQSALGGNAGSRGAGTAQLPCSSPAGGSAGTSGSLGTQGPDKTLFSQWCARLKACDAFRYSWLYNNNEGNCITALSQVSSGETKLVSVHPMLAGQQRACLTAWTKASCHDIFLRLPPPECRDLPGQRGERGICFSDRQCASLNCEAGENGCGACKAPRDRCSLCSSDRDCTDGLRCIGSSCQQPGLIGSPCVSTSDCEGALVCVSRTCSEPLALDANCTGHEECGSETSCVEGRCQQDKIAGEGGTCGRLSDGSRAHCGYGFDCVAGVCVLRPKAGEACAQKGASCVAGAGCVEGVCAALAPQICVALPPDAAAPSPDAFVSFPDAGTTPDTARPDSLFRLDTAPVQTSWSCSCLCTCRACTATSSKTCYISQTGCTSCQTVCQDACKNCSGLSSYSGGCG